MTSSQPVKLPAAGRVEAPCKDCKIRAAGCHAKCMMYANYHEQLKSDRKKYYKQKFSGEAMTRGIRTSLDKRNKYAIQRRTGGKP